MSDDGYTRITLRIPTPLHQKLTQAAAEHSHSMNAEIVTRLDASFGGTEERLSTVEAVIQDDERGNEGLHYRMLEAERQIEQLERIVARLYDR